MDKLKHPSLSVEYIQYLKDMEAIFYPVYPTKDLIVQHYFEPTIKYLTDMQTLLGLDFYKIVKLDKQFIVDKEIWNKHRELIPYLFLPNELSRMQTKLDTNNYKQFMSALMGGAPLDINFVDQLVKKSIYHEIIDINIYRYCIHYASINQFYDLIKSLKDSKAAVPHIKLLLDVYPEYALVQPSPFSYIVEYGVVELVDLLYVGHYDDMFRIFEQSLQTPEIAMFLVDKVNGFSDEEANLLVRTMIQKNLISVCRHFAFLQFKVDFDTQIMIMDHVDYFFILKDKFDLCGVRRFVVIKECLKRYKSNPSLKPMVDFYKKNISANDLKDIQRYALKF